MSIVNTLALFLHRPEWGEEQLLHIQQEIRGLVQQIRGPVFLILVDDLVQIATISHSLAVHYEGLIPIHIGQESPRAYGVELPVLCFSSLELALEALRTVLTRQAMQARLRRPRILPVAPRYTS